MNDMSAISQAFIKAPHFAVVGASVNREKFGNRVLRWFVYQKEPELLIILLLLTLLLLA